MYSGGSYGFENTRTPGGKLGHGFKRLCDQRMLTILCYLNPDWMPGDGGAQSFLIQGFHDMNPIFF